MLKLYTKREYGKPKARVWLLGYTLKRIGVAAWRQTKLPRRVWVLEVGSTRCSQRAQGREKRYAGVVPETGIEPVRP